MEKIVESYFVVELPPSACALAITEDNKVILAKQYRHPLGETLTEIPGGSLLMKAKILLKQWQEN